MIPDPSDFEEPMTTAQKRAVIEFWGPIVFALVWQWITISAYGAEWPWAYVYGLLWGICAFMLGKLIVALDRITRR